MLAKELKAVVFCNVQRPPQGVTDNLAKEAAIFQRFAASEIDAGEWDRRPPLTASIN
jgi:hypothetical protein